MGSPAPATEQNRFWAAAAVAVALTAIFALLLQPSFSLPVRQTASSLGLLLAGVLATVSTGRRSLRSQGLRRRAWVILTVAGVVAILGNMWVAATGSDPVSDPSIVSNVSIAAALLLSIAGLLSFPTVKRRGAELLLMTLDGLVAAGALIIIVTVLVYSDLLAATVDDSAGSRFFALTFPVLDVVLATVAVLLILRSSRADRPALSLVASGFLLYAVSDLAFADLAAQGQFEFGSLLDLGWIAGYLTLGLAAWYPPAIGAADEAAIGGGLSDALGTTLVFALLLAAAVVQILFGTGGDMVGYQSALWLTLIVAAGGRQILLTADNAGLRHGLERRVEEQTADLRRLARQTEVLLTSVGDGIYGVDHEGRVTFINPSGAKALGYTAGAARRTPRPRALPRRRRARHALPVGGLLRLRGHAQRRGRQRGGGQLRPGGRHDLPGRDHRLAAGRRERAARCRRGLPRRHPAPRGGPDEERVPLGGQPRAAHPPDLDPGLPGPARRRTPGRAPRPRRLPGDRRPAEQRTAHPADQRPARHRADRVGHPARWTWSRSSRAS